MAGTVVIESLQPHADHRGLLVEPLAASEIAAQHNVHIVVTHTGGVRGNHLHARGIETTVVIGPARVRYRDGHSVQDVDVASGEVCRFTFPPGVAHAYAALGPEPMLLVGFNTVAHDPRAPDAVPVPLFPS